MRVENDLRESERRLSQTLESISDGVITLDSNWRFTYANPAAERILGLPQRELLGQCVWDLFPEMVGTHLERDFRRVLAEKISLEVEGSNPRTQLYFSNRVYPGLDGGLVIYFHDTTQRRRAEEAQREADRRKDEFLATLAHELRNPLAPIRNAATLLLRKGPADPQLKWSAEIINRQVRHMSRLLEDLLDVSRISRNRLELRREWIDLASAISSAVEASRPLIDEQHQELTVNLAAGPIYIDADPVRLAQVFSNLLNNAAKYTQAGGHLRLNAEVTGTGVTISVSDDGIGMAREMLPHLFEMFYQATPALQRSQGGLGVGLSLARGIVELHGGKIEARSAGLGRGSEFIVHLPVVRDATRPEVATAEEAPGPVKRRRLIVVDDVRDNADSLAEVLRVVGHEVHAVYDGRSALELAEELRPEVILLDIGMPDLDGLEVCRALRQQEWGRKLFIVALTGWGQESDRRRTKDAGFDHHLIKPVEMSVLSQLLS